MKNEDVELIQNILAGDENAFVSLVEKYQKQVHALAWRKIGDFHIAEEITQDTFLKVYQKLSTLKDSNQFAGNVAFSHDGETIAINCSSDLNIQIWDVSTRRYQGTLRGHTANTMDVVFSPDGNTLASACLDGTLRLWNYNKDFLRDLRVGRKIPRTKLHIENMRWWGIIFSPDNSTIAGYGQDGTVLLLDAATGQQKTTIMGHTNGVYSIGFSPDSSIIVSGKGDQVLLWDANTGHLIETLNQKGLIVSSVAFSRDGNTLASGNSDNTVLLWDMETRQLKSKIIVPPLEPDIRTGIRIVVFSPDGKTLVSSGGHEDGSIYLWDVASGQLEATLQGHIEYVQSISFSPDGKTLASCRHGDTIKLWDVANGNVKRILKGHTDNVYSVVFSPDGKTLASGSGVDDESIRLWDVATGQYKAQFKGDMGWVLGVAFSPDGKTLASGDTDKQVQLWDIGTKQQIALFEGHKSNVECVVYSP